jgi:hypothetical protein
MKLLLFSRNHGHPEKFSFFIFFLPRIINVNISVSRRLHRDINGDNDRADVIALAVRQRDKSGGRKARRERLE